MINGIKRDESHGKNPREEYYGSDPNLLREHEFDIGYIPYPKYDVASYYASAGEQIEEKYAQLYADIANG